MLTPPPLSRYPHPSPAPRRSERPRALCREPRTRPPGPRMLQGIALGSLVACLWLLGCGDAAGTLGSPAGSDQLASGESPPGGGEAAAPGDSPGIRRASPGGGRGGGGAGGRDGGAAGGRDGGAGDGRPTGASRQDAGAGDASASGTGEHDAGAQGATEHDAGEPGGQDAGARDAGDRDGGAAHAVHPHSPCDARESYGEPLPSGDLEAEEVAGGFTFLEGPVWFADLGVLYFSDMLGASGPEEVVASRIMRLTPPSTVDVFEPDSGSNGLAIAPDGRILAATHDQQTLSYFDATTGQRETPILRHMNNRFNSPNDIAVRADGHIYFTDPDWQLGARSSETGITGFYHVTPAGTVTLVDDDPDHELDKPNGIALSPDGMRLYVGSYEEEIWYYDLDVDGNAGGRALFAGPGAGDGMTVDCAGNLYATVGKAVVVFEPTGDELGRIELPDTAPAASTNVAFGGDNGQTLYITAGPGLYALALEIPGHPF